MQKGIENLFDSEFFSEEQRFFSITKTEKDGNIINKVRELRKKDFQKFILEERNEENDFKRFEELFKFIEKSWLCLKSRKT